MNHHQYQSIRSKLLVYFQKRYLNPWDTEDLIQEVMLKLWRIGKPINESELAYIYTVAKHLMIDKFRANSRQQADRHISAEYDDIKSHEDTSPEYGLQEQRLVQSLQTSLSRLSPLQRHTFIDGKLNGLRLQDIARQRNVTVSAAEKVMSKAVHTIRRSLADNGDSECA